MKKYFLCAVLLLPLFVIGCSDDDDNGVEPPPATVVTAVAASTDPGTYNSSAWSSINPVSVDITSIALSKLARSAAELPAVEADDVQVRAATYMNKLYIRLDWADTSYDAWRDHFSVRERDEVLGWVLFTHNELAYVEDACAVMLQDTETSDWDIWHWRVVTTDGGNVAEDARLEGGTYIVDSNSVDHVICVQNGADLQPLFVHNTLSAYTSPILLHSECDTLSPAILADEGWEIGDRVAGWRTIDTLTTSAYGSIYDVAADSHHDNVGYTVVLSRDLDTGNDDDLPLASGNSYPIRLVIGDNADISFTSGYTGQGFTPAFTLRIP